MTTEASRAPLPFRSALHLKQTIAGIAIATGTLPLILFGGIVTLLSKWPPTDGQSIAQAGVCSLVSLGAISLDFPTLAGIWLGTLGLTVCLTAGLAIYISKRVLQYVQTLVQTLNTLCTVTPVVSDELDAPDPSPSPSLAQSPPLVAALDELEALDRAISRTATTFNQLYGEQTQQAEVLQGLNTDLEEKFHQRTEQLYSMIHQLKQEVLERKQTEIALRQSQSKLIQTEKMSGLGHMVAGIAHEINNPINFIYGNLKHVQHHAHDILTVLETYQAAYPDPAPEVKAIATDLDVEFVTTDLRKVVSSMRMGTERILDIVQSLRTFSRIDQVEFKPADLHSGLDNTLLILKHRLKPHGNRPQILVVKRYGDLPLVDCHAGQLNQVFMNILANAIDALDDAGSLCALRSEPPMLIIETSCLDGDRVAIKITDNGPGIPDYIQAKLFDPFFTTKPIGKGTGLGMSISYTIVNETHGGALRLNSTVEQGAEFLIELPIRSRRDRSQ